MPDAVTALAARGVRTAVILSSGFGEVDESGRSIQAGMLATARAAGLRLVGPNCMGVYSAPARLNGTYFWDLPRAAGGISIVSQSGAYGGLIFRHLGSRGLGVARFVSIGNQVGRRRSPRCWSGWSTTRPPRSSRASWRRCATGPASWRRPEGRRRACRSSCSRGWLGGGAPRGRLAHGLAGRRLGGPIRAACASAARVVLAEETEEFFDAIETLVAIPARAGRAGVASPSSPSRAGRRWSPPTAAEREGLPAPALGESRAPGPARAGCRPSPPSVNPVDLTPQVEPARIGPAVRRVFDEPDVAGVVAVNVGLDFPEFAAGVVAAARATGKPAVAFTADAPGAPPRGCGPAGVPVLPSPERAVRAWRALWQARPPAPRAAGRGAAAAARGWARRAWRRRAARCRTPSGGGCWRRAASASVARRSWRARDDALAAAERIGYPVVIKADAAGLTHKTEVGGVVLDVGKRAAAVRGAAGAALAGRAERFVVQERVGPGVELLAGRPPRRGLRPVVVLGAGGVLAEALPRRLGASGSTRRG